MNRREFLASGSAGVVLSASPRGESVSGSTEADVARYRSLFPRLQDEVFLNAAAGTPLGAFAEAGLKRYQDFWRSGPADGRGEYVQEMLSEIRGLFGRFIGAEASEIGFVHCTKSGEQIVIDGLTGLRSGGNIVTNDLHFSGSLHNYLGLREAGMDVRIVRHGGWQVSLESMRAAIDEKTRLVAVTLVSNINGSHEAIRELVRVAHSRGALVYADIIQAAGIVSMDLKDVGVDFAACSGYKWLYGPHGVGFFYARKDLQGAALKDRLFPGHARFNYPPWVESPDPEQPDLSYRPRQDARRFEPGHVSYLGYCALFEGLKFLDEIGIQAVLDHSTRLIARLVKQVDPDRYTCISPHVGRSGIVTFQVDQTEHLRRRLESDRIIVSLGGGRLRVSPALYNTESDVDRLAGAMGRS